MRANRANELRADRRGQRAVKGARWLLLKHRDNLNAGQDVAIDEFAAANHSPSVVNVLRATP